MAGDAGFEPTNARIKTWCLTAWRIPFKINGVSEGIRTPDTRLRRPVLYPTELQTQNGAENGTRTRDPRLGKAMLYH